MVTAGMRDDDLSRAFAVIAGSFDHGFGVIDMLHTVVAQCACVFGISDVGVVLAGSRGRLNVAAATSERTTFVELLQIEDSAGPCWRAFQTGGAVSIPAIRHADGADIRFRELALGQGLRSVYATPLRGPGGSIGALNLFSTGEGFFSYEDELVADAFARIAVVTLLADRQHAPAGVDRTVEALQARGRIEQAKSFLAAAAGISVDDAFRRIRDHSLATATPLAQVARALLDRVLHL